jgi:hypothetical protein
VLVKLQKVTRDPGDRGVVVDGKWSRSCEKSAHMLIHGLPRPMTEKETKSSSLLLSGQCQTRIYVRISDLPLMALALTDPTCSYDHVKYIGQELMESFRADCVCPA